MPRKGRGAICFTNGNVTEYVYSASGQKLRVKHYTAVPNITRPLGVQPPELTAGQILHTDVTDYLLGGRVTMRGGRVDKVLFEGGYCQATQAGSSSDSFAFYYYNQDHLGNIREVVDATGTVRQVTNYYPFGTPYCDDAGATSPDFQPYKYNGKELDRMHGLDTYDYGARQYDPVLCRWDRMESAIPFEKSGIFTLLNHIYALWKDSIHY
jgi:RHS repeat-associated protein